MLANASGPYMDCRLVQVLRSINTSVLMRKELINEPSESFEIESGRFPSTFEKANMSASMGLV